MNSTCLRLVKVFLTLAVSAGASSAFGGKTLSNFTSRWSGSWEQLPSDEGSFRRLTTSPLEGPSYVAMDTAEPFSLKNRHLRIRIRINSLDAWQGIEARISEDTSMKNYYAISIPLYSDPEFNLLQPGQWADLTLSLGEARIIGSPRIDKMTHIGFYVSGKPGSVIPFSVDLQSFSIATSVPTSIISMTFDDGYDDHLRAAEIMVRYGLRGTAYIMTNEINQSGYLTSDELLRIVEDYGWSISSHHKTPITEFSLERLSNEFQATFDFLETLGLGMTSDHFAYPLGKQDRNLTLPLIRESFSTARIAGGGAETLPPSDWHMLRTFNVTPDITPQMLERRIQKAIDHNEWLILMFHYFTDDVPKNELTIRYSDFEKFCEVIRRLNVRVHPVDEVHKAFQ